MGSVAQEPGVLPEVEQRERRLAWLALVLTPGLGPTRVHRAVEGIRALTEGGAERLFSLSLTELEGLRIPARSAQFLADGRAQAEAEKEWALVASAGAAVLTPEDEAYPGRLLEIYDPPPVLWVHGDREILRQPGMAVVGTRAPSTYGAGMSELLSRDMAIRGMNVLSGMARGVDTAAHKGALAAGSSRGVGKTVAVWGTGLDVVYPKENKKLAEQILASGGAILTEFPMGTFPAPQNFPIRNRTLSGMSVGVLVVEGGEHSGTRITARCAMEQNRDVFAVPGNVTNKNAWGPNTLIKQGARLTATWEDVWEELPSEIRLELEERVRVPDGEGAGQPASKLSGAASLFNEAAMSATERQVFACIRHDEPVQLDDLMEMLAATLGSAEVFAALFELELSGKIRAMPGKHYVRTF